MGHIWVFSNIILVYGIIEGYRLGLWGHIKGIQGLSHGRVCSRVTSIIGCVWVPVIWTI